MNSFTVEVCLPAYNCEISTTRKQKLLSAAESSLRKNIKYRALALLDHTVYTGAIVSHVPTRLTLISLYFLGLYIKTLIEELYGDRDGVPV